MLAQTAVANHHSQTETISHNTDISPERGIYMIKLSSVEIFHHVHGLPLSSFHQQTLASATVCFLIGCDPKCFCQL